jgi:hypothetical protein
LPKTFTIKSAAVESLAAARGEVGIVAEIMASPPPPTGRRLATGLGSMP